MVLMPQTSGFETFQKFFLLIKLLFIVVQLQLSAFSPHPSTPPKPNPPPSLVPTLPLGFVHVSFIAVPENPSPHCPLPTPLWLLVDCSSLQCLWLYFVCFFLLLIRFQLKVRSFVPHHLAYFTQHNALTFNWNIINRRKKQTKYNQRH